MAEWQSLNVNTHDGVQKRLVSDYLHSLGAPYPALHITGSSVSVYASNDAVLYNIENNEKCLFNQIMNGIADRVRQHQGVDFDNIDCTVSYKYGPTNDIVINKYGVFETAQYKKETVTMVPDPQDELDYDTKFIRHEHNKPFKIYDSDPEYKPTYEIVIVEPRRYESFAVVKDYDGDQKVAWREYDKNNDELIHHFYSDSNEAALDICDMFGVIDVEDQSSKPEKQEAVNKATADDKPAMDTQRYYVDSYYDYWANPPIDYVIIGHATKQMEEHDGYNFVGSYDAADFNIYDSLEDAIKHSNCWPGAIQYDGDFSDIEREIIVDTTNKLISDTDFCKKFGRNVDSALFTDNDIKSADNNDISNSQKGDAPWRQQKQEAVNKAKTAGDKSVVDQMTDYMTSHNYGKEDKHIYENDPEWQELNDMLKQEVEVQSNDFDV